MSTHSYPIIPAAEVQIAQSATLLKAMETINKNDAKIALVVDMNGMLLGSLTDGDIRRGLLRGLKLDSLAPEAMHANPHVMHATSSRQQILAGMQNAQVRQMPLIEADGRLSGIALYDMISGFMRTPRSNPVVIMAGGKGKRLLPLTRDIPKPMVEVGGKPMLEHIIQQFVRQGFSNFHIALNYLGHIIEDYFGDGSMWDCKIQYMREEDSLGTAGAMSLITDKFSEPFVVINGDIISSVDFCELIDFHLESNGMATVGARTHRMEVPFGVLQLKDGQLEAIVEKPVYENLISAGIYALSPDVLSMLAPKTYLDMPNLLQTLVEQQKKVSVFPLFDDWLDVGRLDDLVKAKRIFNEKVA